MNGYSLKGDQLNKSETRGRIATVTGSIHCIEQLDGEEGGGVVNFKNKNDIFIIFQPTFHNTSK